MSKQLYKLGIHLKYAPTFSYLYFLATMNVYSHSSEFIKVGKGSFMQASLDLDILGLAKTDGEFVKKVIPEVPAYKPWGVAQSLPPYLPIGVNDTLPGLDLFAQINIHEKAIQALLLQFDLNPKLQQFNEWRNQIFKAANKYNLPEGVRKGLETFRDMDLSTVLNTDILGKVLPSIS